jgi:diguanylate cyclase (GGDEF)-like protein
LELANRRLHELAITDELTGAFNRKHFSAFCSAALAHRDRDEPLAFCMFDIDLFKSYNERYGMPAGNAVLRAVAHCIRGELRRSGDVLFRLGGEEFGVLFTASTADTSRQFIERLRVAVRSLKIEHLDNPSGVITASFGVGWWDKGVTYRLTSDQMYAVADNMLYEAKESGRDRVAIQPHYEPVVVQPITP